MKIAVITGVSGLVGGELSRMLQASGYEVRGLVSVLGGHLEQAVRAADVGEGS